MEVRVARRVELISILFHFAGGKGYNAFDTPYRRAVDKWFAPFVEPGLLTGPWNYDATAHDACGRRWVYQVVELEGAETNQGLPKPTHTTTELVAHEMSHSFVNPVVERHEDVLVPAAQPLFDHAR